MKQTDIFNGLAEKIGPSFSQRWAGTMQVAEKKDHRYNKLKEKYQLDTQD